MEVYLAEAVRNKKGRLAVSALLVVLVGVTLFFASPWTESAAGVNNRGVALNDSGQYVKAVDVFTEAIDVDPRFAVAYSNRGFAFLQLGEYEKAVADCTKAIELDPGLALAYNNRGLAYIELGMFEEAISDLDMAVELDPTIREK